jgi:hypothetical protein
LERQLAARSEAESPDEKMDEEMGETHEESEPLSAAASELASFRPMPNSMPSASAPPAQSQRQMAAFPSNRRPEPKADSKINLALRL